MNQTVLPGLALAAAAGGDGATNGRIRAELFLPGVDAVANRIAGDYLYCISNPTNAFAAVTRPFTVWQRLFPQGVAGRLTEVGSGTALTNGAVFLLDNNGQPFTGTTPDANCNFTLLAAPGNWQLLAFANGHTVGTSAALSVSPAKSCQSRARPVS